MQYFYLDGMVFNMLTIVRKTDHVTSVFYCHDSYGVFPAHMLDVTDMFVLDLLKECQFNTHCAIFSASECIFNCF